MIQKKKISTDILSLNLTNDIINVPKFISQEKDRNLKNKNYSNSSLSTVPTNSQSRMSSLVNNTVNIS